MRKLIYLMMVSLDGYVEDQNHSLEWVLIDRELHKYVNDQQAEVDTYLYGRGMYETMSAFWPVEGLNPSNPDFVLEFAQIWIDMPKVVFSKTLENVDWNSRLVRGDAAAEVARLKAQPGKALGVGGATLAADLVRQDLVDEYYLFLNPVILGGGKRYFPQLDRPLNLKLVETHTFGSGVVFVRYLRSRER
jgi:dihydrofolate reductase